MERNYHQRLFEALGEIGWRYFLASQNPLSWREKVKEFNKMSSSYPFNELLEKCENGGQNLCLSSHSTGVVFCCMCIS